jgi:hypothetical protein
MSHHAQPYLFLETGLTGLPKARNSPSSCLSLYSWGYRHQPPQPAESLNLLTPGSSFVKIMLTCGNPEFPKGLHKHFHYSNKHQD